MKRANLIFWMIWQADDPKGYPVQTLIEGAAYYANKYGNVPNRAEVPQGTNLGVLSAVADGMNIEVSPTVLPRHIHLTFDPGMNGSKP